MNVQVEVRPAIDPAGRRGVLLQFSHGWLVVQPEGARELAAMLVATADEVDGTV